VNAGVLTNVERVQVQAERANQEDQRVDERLREAQAVVFREAATQDFKVMPEFGG
jgi:hypothetical protein